MTQPAPMPPGWYPDSSGTVSWWDGQRWGQPPPAGPPAAQPVAQAPYTMVTTARKKTSHGLHLFLTIITLGVWGVFVWLPITIIHKFQREKTITRVR